MVCKELCHALDASQGSHVVSNSAVDNLIRQFAISSSSTGKVEATQAFSAEMLAEVAAIELLCPLATRREILSNGATHEAIATYFDVPTDYMSTACEPDYMHLIEVLLRAD